MSLRTMYTDQDRVTALAGVFQAVNLVHGLARRGTLMEHDLEVSVRSLFVHDPDDVLSVYGQTSDVDTGLRAMMQCLDRSEASGHHETLTYALTCMHLERKLNKHQSLLQGIREGLLRAQGQTEQFSLLHDNVLANLANLYVRHVSTIKPRIMVKGESSYLTNPRTINRIRTLLLAAIRSAVLWQQCGGSRLDLFLRRKALIRTATGLLKA